MGAYDRRYMQAPKGRLDEAIRSENYEEAARLRDLIKKGVDVDAEDFSDEEIPSWELIADELRIRLIATIKAAPITSIGDIAMLCDCATSVFRLHVQGQQVDKADEDDTTTEEESTL